MQRFEDGRRRRPTKWVFDGDHSLVWRDGRAQLVPIAEATAAERETGIASIEALSASIVSRFVKSKRAHMSDDRMSDAIAYLIEHAWIESQRFNGSGRLGGFVTARLRWRLVDWYRDEFERRRCAQCGGREGKEHDARCEGRVMVEVFSLDASEDDAQREVEAACEALEVPAPDVSASGVFAGLELSALARWALAHVAVPLADGYTMAHVADQTGRSRAYVSDALAELRGELVALGVAV